MVASVSRANLLNYLVRGLLDYTKLFTVTSNAVPSYWEPTTPVGVDSVILLRAPLKVVQFIIPSIEIFMVND
jgi:hypothetical protein